MNECKNCIQKFSTNNMPKELKPCCHIVCKECLNKNKENLCPFCHHIINCFNELSLSEVLNFSIKNFAATDDISYEIKEIPNDPLNKRIINLPEKKSPYPIYSHICLNDIPTKKDQIQQCFYCMTCDSIKDNPICLSCARICHAGHEIVRRGKSMFTCGCGEICACRSKNRKYKCSYQNHGAKPIAQPMYTCATCGIIPPFGICETCAKICHKNHYIISIGVQHGTCACYHNECYLYDHICNCTFLKTGRNHVRQQGFICVTCGMKPPNVICENCAIRCHIGHDIQSVTEPLTMFCDCYVKDGFGVECQSVHIHKKCSRVLNGLQPINQRLFRCETCNNILVCPDCAAACHSGHKLIDLKYTKKAVCSCGLHKNACRLTKKKIICQNYSTNKAKKLAFYCNTCSKTVCDICAHICHREHKVECRGFCDYQFVCECAKISFYDVKSEIQIERCVVIPPINLVCPEKDVPLKHMYVCNTCKPTTPICAKCAHRCHTGHDIKYIGLLNDSCGCVSLVGKACVSAASLGKGGNKKNIPLKQGTSTSSDSVE